MMARLLLKANRQTRKANALPLAHGRLNGTVSAISTPVAYSDIVASKNLNTIVRNFKQQSWLDKEIPDESRLRTSRAPRFKRPSRKSKSVGDPNSCPSEGFWSSRTYGCRCKDC
jgi:hypothetical protein